MSKTFLRCSAKALEINFTFMLNKGIGRQFSIYLLLHHFFFFQLLLLLVFAMHQVVSQDRLFLLPVDEVPLLHSKMLYKSLS